MFFDFLMLTGGALGDKQHVSSSDFLLLSYGAYIDVNFVVTGMSICVLIYISLQNQSFTSFLDS